MVKAYAKEIMDLPRISNVNLKRIHEFIENLCAVFNESPQTLCKLQQVKGNVGMTFDKLLAIRTHYGAILYVQIMTGRTAVM